MRQAYVEGLVWVLEYYYRGCASWCAEERENTKTKQRRKEYIIAPPSRASHVSVFPPPRLAPLRPALTRRVSTLSAGRDPTTGVGITRSTTPQWPVTSTTWTSTCRRRVCAWLGKNIPDDPSNSGDVSCADTAALLSAVVPLLLSLSRLSSYTGSRSAPSSSSWRSFPPPPARSCRRRSAAS